MADLALDKRLRAAVVTANGVAEHAPERFTMVLERVMDRLPKKGARAFTDSEEAQLAQVLGVGDVEEVRAMVDLTETIFRRTCASGYNLRGLGEAVVTAGGSESLAATMQQAWKTHGPKAMKALKAQPFGTPQYLESVRWQVQVPLAGNDESAGVEPTSEALLGTIDLTLARECGGGGGGGGGDGHGGANVVKESLAVEFTKEELFRFFQDMEKIQGHLDQLS